MKQLVITERENIVAIADAVRANSDITSEISFDGIASGINYVANYVAANTNNGIDTSDATATADDILQGETAYADGQKITGTFSIDNELTTQDDLITQIQNAVDSLPEASSEPVLQTKTVTPTTSAQNVTPDSGYDGLSKVTVNAIPSTYVKPTTTKSATTYTPTTSNQTIAAGTYCSGAQTIKGDANLKAENIAEGVSIFGVTGTYSGGSGGGSVETCTVKFGMPDPGTEIYYLDQTMTLQHATVGRNAEYTILKNTIFIVSGYLGTTLDGYSSICGNAVVRGFLATK